MFGRPPELDKELKAKLTAKSHDTGHVQRKVTATPPPKDAAGCCNGSHPQELGSHAVAVDTTPLIQVSTAPQRAGAPKSAATASILPDPVQGMAAVRRQGSVVAAAQRRRCSSSSRRSIAPGQSPAGGDGPKTVEAECADAGAGICCAKEEVRVAKEGGGGAGQAEEGGGVDGNKGRRTYIGAPAAAATAAAATAAATASLPTAATTAAVVQTAAMTTVGATAAVAVKAAPPATPAAPTSSPAGLFAMLAATVQAHSLPVPRQSTHVVATSETPGPSSVPHHADATVSRSQPVKRKRRGGSKQRKTKSVRKRIKSQIYWERVAKEKRQVCGGRGPDVEET